MWGWHAEESAIVGGVAEAPLVEQCEVGGERVFEGGLRAGRVGDVYVFDAFRGDAVGLVGHRLVGLDDGRENVGEGFGEAFESVSAADDGLCAGWECVGEVYSVGVSGGWVQSVVPVVVDFVVEGSAVHCFDRPYFRIP